MPGFELVTRRVYLELKGKRCSHEQVGIESSIRKANNVNRRSDASVHQLKPLYYAIPIAGFKDSRIQSVPEAESQSEVEEQPAIKLDFTFLQFDESDPNEEVIKSFVVALGVDVKPSLEALRLSLNIFTKKIFSSVTPSSHE